MPRLGALRGSGNGGGEKGPHGHAGAGAQRGALEARGEPRTGNKAWLRRRLHGAIVRAHLASTEDE